MIINKSRDRVMLFAAGECWPDATSWGQATAARVSAMQRSNPKQAHQPPAAGRSSPGLCKHGDEERPRRLVSSDFKVVRT